MQAHAAQHGAPIQLQVTMPGRKWTEGPAPFHVRHFVAVDDPCRLVQVLKSIPARRNHTFEIIQKGKPCKVCMDFDNAAGFPREQGFSDRSDFTHRVQAALGEILLTDFGVHNCHCHCHHTHTNMSFPAHGIYSAGAVCLKGSRNAAR